MQWQNTIVDVCFHQTNFCEKLKKFFLTQLDWIYNQIDTNPLTNFYCSLFQVLTSIDDIAAHLDFQNISQHDRRSALIKVRRYSVIKEKFCFFLFRFYQIIRMYLYHMLLGMIIAHY